MRRSTHLAPIPRAAARVPGGPGPARPPARRLPARDARSRAGPAPPGPSVTPPAILEPTPMTVSGYAKDDVLVSADWAKAHLDDPTVRFVEVDVDTTAYEQSHIPGAVGWNWTSQLADGVRRDIAGREDFGALLSKSGIGPDTTIVLYGDNNNWFAAWAYWQLQALRPRQPAPPQRRPQVLARQRPAAVDRRAGLRGDRLRAARGRLRAARVPRRHPAARRRLVAGARRRPQPGRVQRRGHRPSGHDRDRAARRPHPGRRLDPVGPDRSARTARSRAATS